MNQAERSWDGMFTAGPFQRQPGSSRLEQGDGHHHVLYRQLEICLGWFTG